MKQVGNVKASQGAHHIERAYFASHRGVLGPLSLGVSFFTDVLEHVFIQTELTQMKLQLDVPLQQAACQSHTIQKQVGAVEMKLQFDFHTGHQDPACVKCFQVRLKHQTVTRSTIMVGCFGLGLGQRGFVVGTEGLIVGMSRPIVGSGVCVVVGPFGWEIQGIEPSLRFQHGFALLPVVIHQGFQIGFVMVRVRLRTDQGAIQSQVNLFDNGVRQFVGDPEFLVPCQVGGIAPFQPQVHREVAAIQIHMVVQSGNDEFHGVDTGGGRLDGYHAVGIDANVRGWDLKHLQPWADDLFGLGVSGLRHVGVKGEFSTSSSSSPSSGWYRSPCGGVFIPSLSSGQLLHQIKVGQAFHTGGQPSSVLRQSAVAARETKS